MKEKLSRAFGRYWAPLFVVLGIIIGNAIVGLVWFPLRNLERNTLGDNGVVWLSITLIVLSITVAGVMDHRWKKMLKRGVSAITAATLIPALLLMQLPVSAQVVSKTSTTTSGLTGIPAGAIVVKTVSVPAGSTVHKNVNGSVTVVDPLGNETQCERLSYIDSNGKKYEIDPIIVHQGEDILVVWALAALVVLCGVLTYALIKNWPDDNKPPTPPPPPPVITTNLWPLTGPLPKADYYETSCCPWTVFGITTNVPPPKGKHWWNISSTSSNNGATATVTMITEKTVSSGMIDPYVNPKAFLGLEKTTNCVQSYHVGRIDMIAGATSTSGPWKPFKMEFWRSGNIGTVIFSDDLGQRLFHTTVTLTESGFFGIHPEGFRLITDPAEPQHFFKFP